jgi:hypothetical protein
MVSDFCTTPYCTGSWFLETTHRVAVRVQKHANNKQLSSKPQCTTSVRIREGPTVLGKGKLWFLHHITAPEIRSLTLSKY